jgi:CheY-like chemotaxis protein
VKDNPLILSVDRNHKNLELLTFLGREGYQVLAVSSIEEFEQALMHSKEINLALVDIAGERSPHLAGLCSPAD